MNYTSGTWLLDSASILFWSYQTIRALLVGQMNDQLREILDQFILS